MTGTPDSLSVRCTGHEPPLSEGGRGTRARGRRAWELGRPQWLKWLCLWPGPGSTTRAFCVASRGQPGLGVSGFPQARLSVSTEVQGWGFAGGWVSTTCLSFQPPRGGLVTSEEDGFLYPWPQAPATMGARSRPTCGRTDAGSDPGWMSGDLLLAPACLSPPCPLHLEGPVCTGVSDFWLPLGLAVRTPLGVEGAVRGEDLDAPWLRPAVLLHWWAASLQPCCSSLLAQAFVSVLQSFWAPGAPCSPHNLVNSHWSCQSCFAGALGSQAGTDRNARLCHSKPVLGGHGEWCQFLQRSGHLWGS